MFNIISEGYKAYKQYLNDMSEYETQKQIIISKIGKSYYFTKIDESESEEEQEIDENTEENLCSL